MAETLLFDLNRAAPFETLLNAAPIGVYLVDADFCIRAVNPVALPVFGDIPDLIGRNFEEVIHILWSKDYADEIIGLFRRTLKTGEPCLQRERIEKRRDTGVIEYYEWQVSRVTLPNGCHGVVCYFRDISVQKRQEQALREREQQLAAELDAMQRLQALSTELLHHQDPAALYEKALDTAIALTGSDFASIQMLYRDRGPTGELRLLAFRGFTPDAARLWQWVGVDCAGTTCGTALRTQKRVVVDDVETCSFMVGTKDLDMFRQIGIRACQTTPLISRDGRLVGMISTQWRKPHQPSERTLHLVDLLARQMADLMERIQAHEALRQSEQRYRSLFESIDEGFCVIEMIFDERNRPIDYRFVEVNPAFEKQAGMHGATGKRMLEFVSYIEPHWLENYGRVAMTGEPIRFADEYKSLHSWFDVYAFRVGDPQSRRVAVIFNNITARKQAEAALLQSQADLAAANEQLNSRAKQLDALVAKRTEKLTETIGELEAFSYSISHDMRAPLRAMQSFSALLAQDYHDKVGPEGKDFIRRIVTSAHRMDRLIQDVLVYSRMTRSELKLETVNVETLINGILESYPHLHENKAKFEIESIPLVHGNEAALTQCFSNLLGNAIKFVEPNVAPHVRVWGEQRDGKVFVFVQDNGIGVAEEYHQKIFGIFQQLNKRYDGTGIGLAIVKKAAERMGGRVGLNSCLGKGSTFWLELQPASCFPIGK